METFLSKIVALDLNKNHDTTKDNFIFNVVNIKTNNTNSANLNLNYHILTLTDNKNSSNKFILKEINKQLEIGSLIKLDEIKLFKVLSIKEDLIIVKIIKYSIQNEINEKHILLSQLSLISPDKIVLQIKIIRKYPIVFFPNTFDISLSGCLLNIIVADEKGTEMQLSCCNNQVEKINDQINENDIIKIKGGYLKKNDRSNINSYHDYCLVIDDNTIIKKINDKSLLNLYKFTSFPNLMTIDDVLSSKINSYTDVICIIIQLGIKETRKLANGEILEIKKVYGMDSSYKKIEIALWRDLSNLKTQLGDFLLIKNAKIKEFKGNKFISTIDETFIRSVGESKLFGYLTESQSNEYIMLKKNILNSLNLNNNSSQVNLTPSKLNENNDKKDKLFSCEKYITIKRMIFEVNSLNEQNKYYIKGYIINSFPHSSKNIYLGCPISSCKRKMNDNFCTFCNRIFDFPKTYLNLHFKIFDSTGFILADAIGDIAEIIIKVSGKEYNSIIENNRTIIDLNYKYEYKEFIFGVKLKNTSKSSSFCFINSFNSRFSITEVIDLSNNRKDIAKQLLLKIK